MITYCISLSIYFQYCHGVHVMLKSDGSSCATEADVKYHEFGIDHHWLVVSMVDPPLKDIPLDHHLKWAADTSSLALNAINLRFRGLIFTAYVG